jgi:fused signal recognition particle receptor
MSIFDYKQEPGYFRRLKEALSTTKEDLGYKLGQLSGSAESPITEEQIDDLESVLIGADMGVQTTLEIIDQIREETRKNRFVTGAQVRRLLRQRLLEIMSTASSAVGTSPARRGLEVVFVVGVNGVGKTTTIAKLAHRHQKEGKRVLLSASDTFRAAAIEQLDIWAERTGCEIIKQSAGADAAAVLFDAVAAGRARSVDILIVDTAGRLHNKANLMRELEKLKRIAAREVEGAPHEVFLVLDATTGQNGLVQAQEFQKLIGLTGVIVAKLDGTAKGGIVVAIVSDLGVPVRYVGIGEKLEDLLPFDPEAFIDTLLEQNGPPLSSGDPPHS